MKKIIFTSLFLCLDQTAMAGTNPVMCFDEQGNAVIRLETIGNRVYHGWMVDKFEPLKDKRNLSSGVFMASTTTSIVMILGAFQKAVVIGEGGSIAADLACRGGR